MVQVKILETFVSLQGEGSRAGAPCFFIRMAGCNLKCGYCDTPGAHDQGCAVSVEALVAEAKLARVDVVEVTGGEPLAQEGFVFLAAALRAALDGVILVETNGSLDIGRIPEGVTAIVDVKSPGSGEAGSFRMGNLSVLRPEDELKFVLCDRMDYEWARAFVGQQTGACRGRHVFFSPVQGRLALKDLAAWILEDRLPVQLQVQLHKLAGLP